MPKSNLTEVIQVQNKGGAYVRKTQSEDELKTLRLENLAKARASLSAKKGKVPKKEESESESEDGGTEEDSDSSYEVRSKRAKQKAVTKSDKIKMINTDEKMSRLIEMLEENNRVVKKLSKKKKKKSPIPSASSEDEEEDEAPKEKVKKEPPVAPPQQHATLRPAKPYTDYFN